MGKTKVICFSNNKGGSGKSTTCSNVGYGMALEGKRVLLIDGDMQMNLTLSFFSEDQALELAKSEATKEELKIGEINLSETVENSILQFEVVAFEKNVSIESGIQPDIIVKTHAPTFSKVLEILFDNAIKSYVSENFPALVCFFSFFTCHNTLAC